MATRSVYHVSPSGDGNWKIKEEKAGRAVKITADKSEAISRAKEMAKNAQLGQVIVHDKKGVVQTEYTYGNDPAKSKG